MGRTLNFDQDHAIKYGIAEAVILYNIRHWIELNHANARNRIDGKTWTYQTRRSMLIYFPFFSEDQLQRIFNKLTSEDGPLIKGNYNSTSYDRTCWYAFKDENEWIDSKYHKEHIFTLQSKENNSIPRKPGMDSGFKRNGNRQKPEPIPDILTDALTDHPLPPPLSDQEKATPEEEEELRKRIKERPKKYGPIKSLVAWRATTLKDIREMVKESYVSKSVEKERRKEAMAYDMKSHKGFQICCSKEWVEISMGQAPKYIRYDATQEEWDELPWRRI